ncbi:hypothetical protein Y032_0015g2697 [Ancylostoma ceylanicum]|uniref:Uncharacterized protein n=1 Tax=Ancylostoma ceylanicum TaxID=53326 RepID=A0A016V789_9BILA|nr:hypothetical protein Y032_0015g2697 [Ancylostoma ceylanicum]
MSSLICAKKSPRKSRSPAVDTKSEMGPRSTSIGTPCGPGSFTSSQGGQTQFAETDTSFLSIKNSCMCRPKHL